MSKDILNKSDIIDSIAEAASISKAAAGKALDATLEAIVGALTDGSQVAFTGFGRFYISERAARTGRNPQTGEPIQIKASKIVSFKAGKDLREAVNEGTVAA